MAIPNSLSKYLFSLWEKLYDDSMENGVEIQSLNNAIIYNEKIYWLIDKHGKYDKMKNNIEEMVNYFELLKYDVYFEEEYPLDILIGKPCKKKWKEKIIYSEKNIGYNKNNAYICFDFLSGQIKIISPLD